MKHEPIVLWSSILVFLQVLAGGAALTDVLGKDVVGVFILIVGALQAATQFYVRGQVTPNVDVAARDAGNGTIVAGEAAQVPTGDLADVIPSNGPMRT